MTPGVDYDWDEVMASAEAAEATPVEATHPLYLLYTSGSTGAATHALQSMHAWPLHVLTTPY